MLYSEFISQTCDNKNQIKWNYYNSFIYTANLLQGTNSKNFIYDYFRNGKKELPFFINAESAKMQPNYGLATDSKEAMPFFNYDKQYQLPNDRAVHTVSGFFLGLLIENCINNNTLYMEDYPFTYLWFLTFLYHDYGYCVTERDDSQIPFPQSAPLPHCCNNYRNSISACEYKAISEIKTLLGIDVSPFSPYQLSHYYEQNKQPNIEHALLRELTQGNYTIKGIPNLCFKNGPVISKHRYTSSIVTRYMNYCINDRHHVDHGIVGGYLFYDRMIKNYIISYLLAIQEKNAFVDLSNFCYNSRHFEWKQLKIFSYISDCILSHNIWKQPSNKRTSYKQYKLDALLCENFNLISYEDNPLLYILVVTDSIEPIKIYHQVNNKLSAEDITNAINIEYLSGSRTLSFSSCSDLVDIKTIYCKAKSLEDWTTVKCSKLNEGKFCITI